MNTPMERNVTLVVTANEAQQIINALSKEPYFEVHQTVSKVFTQAQVQLNPAVPQEEAPDTAYPPEAAEFMGTAGPTKK